MSNAIKFRSDKPPVINLKGQIDQEYITVSIEDNGIGIAEDRFNQIFLPFKRLHSSEEIEGSGIGLALVKKILESVNGEVWLESTPGAGSTFYVKLRLAKQD